MARTGESRSLLGKLNKRFDACLFDLYATLVELDWKQRAKRSDDLAKICGVSTDQFLSTWNGLVEESNLGVFRTTEERALEVLRRLGLRPERDRARAMARIEHSFLASAARVFDGAEEILAKIKAAGMGTALVTNASPSVTEVLDSTGLRPQFDVVVISSEVSLRKPDERIYRHALDKLGVAAERAVFVGDGNDRELDGAKSAGMVTVQTAHAGLRAVETSGSSAEAIDYRVESLPELLPLLGI